MVTLRTQYNLLIRAFPPCAEGGSAGTTGLRCLRRQLAKDGAASAAAPVVAAVTAQVDQRGSATPLLEGQLAMQHPVAGANAAVDGQAPTAATQEVAAAQAQQEVATERAVVQA